MSSQDHLGSGQLINRLASQVGSRELAISLLQKRGDLESDGVTLTEKGILRDSMTAEDRAKDRASKLTGRPANNFGYNVATNKAISLNRGKKK